jgi:hypothetical protein
MNTDELIKKLLDFNEDLTYAYNFGSDPNQIAEMKAKFDEMLPELALLCEIHSGI